MVNPGGPVGRGTTTGGRVARCGTLATLAAQRRIESAAAKDLNIVYESNRVGRKTARDLGNEANATHILYHSVNLNFGQWISSIVQNRMTRRRVAAPSHEMSPEAVLQSVVKPASPLYCQLG